MSKYSVFISFDREESFVNSVPTLEEALDLAREVSANPEVTQDIQIQWMSAKGKRKVYLSQEDLFQRKLTARDVKEIKSVGEKLPPKPRGFVEKRGSNRRNYFED